MGRLPYEFGARNVDVSTALVGGASECMLAPSGGRSFRGPAGRVGRRERADDTTLRTLTRPPEHPGLRRRHRVFWAEAAGHLPEPLVSEEVCRFLQGVKGPNHFLGEGIPFFRVFLATKTMHENDSEHGILHSGLV